MSARAWLFLGCLLATVAACRSPSNDAPEADGGVHGGAPAAHPVIARAQSIAARDPHFAKLLVGRGEGLALHDDAFASEGFRRGIDASTIGVRMPRRAGDPWRVGPARIERWSARFSPLGAANVQGVLSDGRLVYENVWPSTDLTVITGTRGTEWMLSLRDATAPTSFTWGVELGSELSLGKLASPTDPSISSMGRATPRCAYIRRSRSTAKGRGARSR